jgi:hypothetical protein
LSSLPKYIESRLRRPPTSDLAIVPGSTPVICFGRFSTSTVATLGLNPSKQEFLDKAGVELDGPRRRFETLNSLGIASLGEAPTERVELVAAACEEYFNRNPYRRWFDQLEPVVSAAGGSYYSGSACHLDLVQWATDPTWGALSDAQRTRLLSEDVGFLRDQLRNSQIRVLLLNGRAVIRHFAAAMCVTLRHVPGVHKTAFVSASVLGVRVIGWSTNVQSSFGVTNELRRALAEHIRELLPTGRGPGNRLDTADRPF